MMTIKYKVAMYFCFIYYQNVWHRQWAQTISWESPWGHWKWCCLVGGKGMFIFTMVYFLYSLLAPLCPAPNSLEDGTRLSYFLRRVQTGFLEWWKHWHCGVQPSRGRRVFVVLDGMMLLSIATRNGPSQLQAQNYYSSHPSPLCPTQSYSPLQSTFARSQWG